MPLIAIDGGHGSDTPGHRTPYLPAPYDRHIQEYEFTHPTAQKTAEAVRRCGMEALLINPETHDIPLHERSSRANQADADAIVSIHANALNDTWGGTVGGYEVFYWRDTVLGSDRLTSHIHGYLGEGTPQMDRGVKQSYPGHYDFHMLRETKMAACLVEALFMDVYDEAVLMLDGDYQTEVAEEICHGLCDYFDVAYVAPPQSAIRAPILHEPTATIDQARAWAKAGECHRRVSTLPNFTGPWPRSGVSIP